MAGAMRLTEHDGKRLLAAAGLRVPDGGWAAEAGGVRVLAGTMRGAVAVKLQVPDASRAAGGWVRRCENAKTAGEAAEEILARRGAPRGFRVERWTSPSREFYAAVVSDPAARAPAILFGAHGGSGVEGGAPPVSRVVSIRRGPTDEDIAACLGAVPGLPPQDAARLAAALRSLWDAYRRNAAVLVEVNPLALCRGEPVALDARVELDPDAIDAGRCGFVPEVPEPPDPLTEAADAIDRHDHRGVAHYLRIDWPAAVRDDPRRIPIGLHCVGTGVSLTCMDELARHRFLPVNFADTSGNPTAAKIYRMVRVLFAQERMEGYFFMTCVSSQQLAHTARGIVRALQDLFPATGGRPDRPCLFCFRGAWEEEARAILRDHGIDGAPNVRVLGPESSERTAADAFAALFPPGRSAAPPALPLREPALHEAGPGIVRLDLLSGGALTIDPAACASCETHACVVSCRSPSDEPVLEIRDGRAALRLDPAEVRRGGCVECLACVLDCRVRGRDAIRVRLPLLPSCRS